MRAITRGIGMLGMAVLTTAPVAAQDGRPPDGSGGWTTTGAMAVARSDHAATLLSDGRVLIVGGSTRDGSPVGAVEVWDPATDGFSAAGSLAEARADPTATLLSDGRVLIVGGSTRDGSPLGTAEVWDPATATASAAGALAEARTFHTATSLPDGRVLVVGGYGNLGGALDSAEVWDPATASFAPAGTLAGARARHTATLLPDGRVLIVAGLMSDDVWLASAEAWDPVTSTFEPAGSLAEARDGHTATLLADGRVLVVGGYSGDAGYHAAAEVWDPSTASFVPAGSLGEARGFHAATSLIDGRVLVVGGYDGEWLGSAEVWDSATGIFGAAGRLAVVRDLHTATLLLDGRVLVTGGYNDHYLTSAEVWDPHGQSIDLTPLPEVLPVTAGPFDLSARASSGLPVVLGTEGPCALVDGSRLALLGVGSCTVTVSQPGDVRWEPAASVQLTTEVVPVAAGDVRLNAASALPPTFVGPDVVVHAILDPNRAPAHFYGLWLDAGATLHPLAVADERILGVSIAQAPITWMTDAADLIWNDVAGPGWLAPSTGLYVIRVADASGPGSPYRYTLSFTIDAPRPLNTMPPADTPLVGEVALGDQVESVPPGTLVASGAVVSAYLTADRPEDVFGIDLAVGDTLDAQANGGVRLHLAYPSDLSTWYPLDGPWLASEAGTYSVRVSAGVVGGGVPYTVTFEIVPGQ